MSVWLDQERPSIWKLPKSLAFTGGGWIKSSPLPRIHLFSSTPTFGILMTVQSCLISHCSGVRRTLAENERMCPLWTLWLAVFVFPRAPQGFWVAFKKHQDVDVVCTFAFGEIHLIFCFFYIPASATCPQGYMCFTSKQFKESICSLGGRYLCLLYSCVF